MIARIALNSKPKLSVDRLLESIRQRLGDTVTVTGPERRDGKLSFLIGDALVQMASSSKPIPWKDDKEVRRNSRQWIKEPSALDHSFNLAFRVSGPTRAWLRAQRLTVVADAALEQCADATGVYWETAGQFIPGDTFRQLASDRHIIANIWVVTRIGRSKRNISAGFTRGLKSFIGRELETCHSTLTPEELRGRLRGLIGSLAEKGVAVKDGESLGQFGDDQVKVKFEDRSKFGNVGPVVSLVYSKTETPAVKPKESVGATYSIPVKAIKQAAQPKKRKTHTTKLPTTSKPETGKATSRPSSSGKTTSKPTSTSPVPDLVSESPEDETTAQILFQQGLTLEKRKPVPLFIAVFASVILIGAVGWFLFSQLAGAFSGNNSSSAQTPSAQGKSGANNSGKVANSKAQPTNSGQPPRFIAPQQRSPGATSDEPVVDGEANDTPMARVLATRSMVYTSDSKYLIAATNNSVLRIFDAETMALLNEYSVDEEMWSELHLTMSGFANRLFVGGRSGRVHAYEILDGGVLTLLGRFEGHHSPVTSLAAGPFGKWVCSGERGRKAALWDSGSYSAVTELNLSGPALAIRFSDDGEAVMVVDEKQLTLIDIRHSKLNRENFADATLRLISSQVQSVPFGNIRVPALDSIRSACISADLDSIALLSRESILLFDYADRLLTPRGVIKADEKNSSILFRDDGKRLLSGTKDVVVWDYRNQKLSGRLLMSTAADVEGIAVSPDGSKVAAFAERTMTIEVLQNNASVAKRKRPAVLARFPKTGKMSPASINTIPDTIDQKHFQIVSEMDHKTCDPSSLRSTPDGKFFVVLSDRNEELVVFDAETGEQVCRGMPPENRDDQALLDMPKNASRVATANEQEGFDVWQIDESGQATVVGELSGISGSSRLITFDAGGYYFWSLDKENRRLSFSSIEHSDKPIIIENGGMPADFAFSPNGDWTYAASGRQRVRVRLEDREVEVFESQSSPRWPAFACAFSKDGSLFAEVRQLNEDLIIQFYDPTNEFMLIGEKKIDFPNRTNDEIIAMGFSPDQKQIYVATSHRLKIFEVESGRTLIEYDMADSDIMPFDWRDDGVLVSCISSEGSVSPRVIRLKFDE